MLALVFSGVVQGVGFRPSVYRIATELGLQGGVYNDSSTAIVLLSCPLSLPTPESSLRFARFYPFQLPFQSPLRILPTMSPACAMLGDSRGGAVYASSPLCAFLSQLFSALGSSGGQVDSSIDSLADSALESNSAQDSTADSALDSALPLAPFAKITQIECFSLESALRHIPSLDSALRELRAKAHQNLGFHILHSASPSMQSPSPHQSSPNLPKDAATCPACLREIFDAHSRFYRYHLTACTLCGARYSIMRALPYDRERTSMRDFPLCSKCQRDFKTPSSRFFHAQPLSCGECAIELKLLDSSGACLERDYGAIMRAAELLERGEILCIKGLGGFALICDSSNARAVQSLRERKRRARKPLAIMCRDLPQARKVALLSQAESSALIDSSAPIVLAWSNPTNPLSLALEQIAPNLATIGVLLANTPLHHLLLDRFAKPIIYTSANLPGEPIITECAQAIALLGSVARHFVEIDRKVVHGIDDSILRYIDNAMRPIRLARGKTPESSALMELDSRAESSAPPRVILALGANDKITPAIIQSGQSGQSGQASTGKSAESSHIIITPYIGTLESPSAQARLESNLALFLNHSAPSAQSCSPSAESTESAAPASSAPPLSSSPASSPLASSPLAPTLLVSDKHPRYQSTHIARDLARALHIPHLQIYHHHAHHYAILHEIQGRVGADAAREILSVIWDGSGLGEDGSIWGGEFFYGDMREARRVGHFAPFALLGGEKAIKDIARIAYVLALHAGHEPTIARYEQQISPMLQALARKTLAESRRESSPLHATSRASSLTNANYLTNASSLTSSVGRLIDGVAHLLGLLESTSYEGEAGALLESCALRFCDIRLDSSGSGRSPIIDLTPYPYTILHSISRAISRTHEQDETPMLIAWDRMIRAICEEHSTPDPQKSTPKIAYRFLYTLAHIARDFIERFAALSKRNQPNQPARALCVGFSGGVFQNKLLCEILGLLLRERGISYHFHTRVPCNDGGLAYGQGVHALSGLSI